MSGTHRHSISPSPVVSSGRIVDAFFTARGVAAARRFLLAEGDAADTTTAPGRVRFLSLPIELAEGAKTSWVTVTRTGTFTDPRYGTFDITPAMLAEMVRNFDARVLGQDVFIDVSHRHSDGAAAKVLKLAVEGTKLRALVEWTGFGIDSVRNRGFSYLSADFNEQWRDNEQGHMHGCVLLGAGLTTRPVIKRLDPVQLAEADDDDDAPRVAVHPQLLKTLTLKDTDTIMEKHLEQLRVKLLAMGLLIAHAQPILDAARKQLETAGTDEAKCLALVAGFEAVGEAAAAEVKRLAAAGGGSSTITLNPTITLAGPDAAAMDAQISAGVTRALAERDKAATDAAATLASKTKLLADAVAACALSQPEKDGLLAELKPMVDATMSDDQVKRLAEFTIGRASQSAATSQLRALGYVPISGTAHITVDSSNTIRALQDQIDRRLSLADMSAAQRYGRTGGQLLEGNKKFADKVLALFDATHGERLHAEHKMLSGGTGRIADTAVPAIFERTLVREALYNLQALSFVDVGTAPFTNVVNIPYSYRDTTAAGINSTRVYEAQGIPRAGYIQTSEEARPLPQKLAFHISNEMRYLTAAAAIDYDPLAQNVQNIVRIIGEDTDRILQNEILNSADEYGAAAQTDTLTSQVNGTNNVFVLSKFPAVRPRSVYDLTGTLVGSVVNPITVTLNSVVRTEYVSGVTLAAGLYWVADYNMGEIRFVNEAGVLQTPTNAWVLTVTYKYATNVVKRDLDFSSPTTVKDVYDDVLTKIGARKVVIENDRYAMANMLLMSGAVDNALGQANTFTANASRPGTGLSADGSVGLVKGITAFNTRAPGLLQGDVRIIVGERGTTRFRMVRPFQMVDPSEARNSAGLFIGAKEGYGEQYIVSHTPSMLKNRNTSVLLYSGAARVARAA